MHGTFYFRPVGQGCFYTGAIGEFTEPWHQRFRIVYDCGSSTSKVVLEKACQEFSEGCAGTPLHALVISHLDADHVNGIDTLISLMSPTQQVFLPYLSPVERFLCALKFSSEDPTYYEFLSDPVLFLERRGVQEVIFVTGGGPDGDPHGEEPTNPDQPKSPPEKPKLSLINAEPDPQAEADYGQEQSASQIKPAFITHRKSIFLSNLWRFRFFNRREFGVSLDTFAKCETFLARTAINDEEKMLQEFLSQVKKVLSGFSVKKIVDAIANERTRKELKSAYSRIQSAHNDVSLVLWHGPVLYPGQSCGTQITGQENFSAGSAHYWIKVHRALNDRGGTMLTGDIAIKADTANRFAAHYNSELPQTSVFYMPHHGSNHNWMLDRALLSIETFCVASAGIHNSHGHPDPFLLDDVRSILQCPVFWSNEERGVKSWVRT